MLYFPSSLKRDRILIDSKKDFEIFGRNHKIAEWIERKLYYKWRTLILHDLSTSVHSWRAVFLVSLVHNPEQVDVVYLDLSKAFDEVQVRQVDREVD